MSLLLIPIVFLSCIGACYTQTNEEKLSSFNNQFAVDLYKKLIKADENLICSPFSVSTVLSMLWAGATGKTNTEMKQALGYQTIDQSTVDEAFKSILPKLASSENYTLSVANGLFVTSSFKVLQSFVDHAKKYYESEVDALTGVDQINEFAAKKTNNFIKKILDELPDDVLMVLINAVYFKGSWESKFSEDENTKSTFANNDNTNKKVQTTFMNKFTISYPYYDSGDLNAQVLHLPYKGNSMLMIVLLPNSGSTLAQLESKLTGTSLKSAIDNAFEQKVLVTLPKFETESYFNLNAALKSLGMNEAFSNGAQFDKLNEVNNTQGNKRMKVSDVIQKARIKVNEEGTEAAAVTVVIGVGTTSVGATKPQPKIFKADHPFLYVLYHKPTKSALFMGRYTKV